MTKVVFLLYQSNRIEHKLKILKTESIILWTFPKIQSRYKKCCYEFQWENSPWKSQFIKVDNYRLRYGLQHGLLAHTEQHVITCAPLFSPKTNYCTYIGHIKMKKWY